MKIVYHVSLGPHCLSTKADTGTPRPKQYDYFFKLISNLGLVLYFICTVFKEISAAPQTTLW